MFKKQLLIFLILIQASTCLGEDISMRRCMLLPISDSVTGAVSFQVFDKLEMYLKDSGWCYYRHNSEIINILKNYKKNIYHHLNNSEVKKVIATKTNSGSLIKIDIKSLANGSEISMKIFGSNGVDKFIDESTIINNSNIDIIVQKIIHWLSKYEKIIPYDGKVIGVLGNQFTLDTGSLYGLMEGDAVDILRVYSKKIHPLLKTVVDWKVESIGTGKIFHARKSISQAKVSEYESKKRLRLGDWVVIRKSKRTKGKDGVEIVKYPEADAQAFGRLGTLSFDFVLGSGSVALETGGNITRKMSGLMYGARIDLELWATREFWGSFEIEKKFGSLSRDEGTFSKKSNNADFGQYKMKVGYRYLPLGFFYGPRVDGYIGYAKYSFGLDNSSANSITAASISGMLFGMNGNIPILNKVRIWVELDFILGASYSEDTIVYGEDESSSAYHLEFGGSYIWSPAMSFQGSIGYVSSKAGFENPERDYRFKDTSFRTGVTFTF